MIVLLPQCACRIVDYGKTVEVLGTKKEINVVITPKQGETVKPVLEKLQGFVGQFPVMKPACM